MSYDHLKVKDIMSTYVKTLTTHDRVQDAESLMNHFEVSSVPILNDKEQVVGVFTKNDLNQSFSKDIHLTQFCQKNVLSIEGEASLAEAAEILQNNKIHHLIVTNESGKAEGILSTFDFLDLVKF